MASKRKPPPSPLKTGLKHAGLSFVTFAAITGGMALLIQMKGDARDSAPQTVVGLFNTSPTTPISLKERLHDDEEHQSAENEHGGSHEEPSLGVDDLNGEDETHHAENDHGEDTEDSTPASYTSTETAVMGLPKAPIDGVWEWGSNGRIPKIADDGRTPRDVYKRPFSNPAGRPEISIIMGGLGLNKRVTQAAIDELPPEVTLSFVPYSRGLQTWVDKARAAGHEVLIEFPMEPYDYPNNDTGPYTLLTTANAKENRRRTEWLLSQANGIYGVTNYQGAKYATDSRAISPVFELLEERGLAFIHDGSAPRSSFETVAQKTGLPFAEAARVIDSDPSGSAIDEQLLHLEAIALQTGRALGTGFAFPITVDQLRDWTATLDSKGYVLAPASAQLRSVPVIMPGASAMEEHHGTDDHASDDHDATNEAHN